MENTTSKYMRKEMELQALLRYRLENRSKIENVKYMKAQIS